MNKYELTVVFPGDTGAPRVKNFKGVLKKTLGLSSGKVIKDTEWGKIELFYPIKKNKTGLFLHFELEVEGSGIKALADKFKLEDDIIRYLLVKKE